MLKKYLSVIYALSFVLTSCVNEIKTGSYREADILTFVASFDTTATKAQLHPGETSSRIEWRKNDQVGVFTGGKNVLYKATSSGWTTTLVTEQTDVPTSGRYYSVFPYNSTSELNGSTISTVLPSEQTAIEGNFTTHLAVATSTTTAFAYKNVCALVKVNISSDNVTKVIFEGNSSEQVSGGINVEVSSTPSWSGISGAASTSVTLLPQDAATLKQGDYYFAVLPQTFEKGFKVTAYKGESATVVRNVTSKITIERCQIVGGKPFGINGQGTQASPYILTKAQDLVDMRSLAKLNDETWFEMGADIDMAKVDSWIPVNYDQNYTRKIHFDGKGYTISNFTCNFNQYPSLFGVLYGSCVNLKVLNAKIQGTCSAGIIGGYCGTTNKPATVSDVYIEGTVHSTADRVGGFAGVAVCATFTNCSGRVSVSSAKTDVGGFVGKIQGECSFTDCWVNSKVSSTATTKQRCGGFAGWVSGTTVTFTRCTVRGGSTITDNSSITSATPQNTGGFMAYAGSSIETVVDNCSSTCEINSANGKNIGGLIGLAGTGKVTVKNSRVSGGTINAHSYAGGLIGTQETAATVNVTNSYSCADINAVSTAGCIVGSITGNATISDSYYNGIFSLSPYTGTMVGQVNSGTVNLENLWTHTTISEGLTCHVFNACDKSTGSYSGSEENQIVQVLEIDLNNSRYGLDYYYHGKAPGETPTITNTDVFTSYQAEGKNPVVSVNGGYEPPSTFVRTKGITYSAIPNETVMKSGVLQWKNDAGFYFNGNTVMIENVGISHRDKTIAQQREHYANRAETWDNMVSSAPMLIDNYDPVGERFINRLTGLDRDLTSEEMSTYNSEDPINHQGVRHPRTIYALTADNHLLLMVVNGRFSGKSAGMSAKECTRFIKRHFNPQYAINMDGGGSSTMNIKGEVVNYPTDNKTFDHSGVRKLCGHLVITDSQLQ